ncbi:MAG: alpha/beta fold hydrolase [Candidatus Marinimicrobia bacterium]|nr:alpha/beta fold hydrolase [Candidatus Neomarinimicrobiota bacterium]
MIITILIILIFILLIFVVSLFIGSHSYKFKKEPNKYTPAKYGFGFDEISIPTKNNKNLYGWWIPAENPTNENKPTIILIHGWSRNVDRTMAFIKKLQPAGYNLLAFDSRSHGKSDDDKYSSMVKFMEDIRAAIDFSEKQPNTDINRVGLLGLSIGGSASIYAATLDKRIKSVVTVGAFSHPKKVMGLEFKKHKIPYYPFVWIIFKYMEFRIGAKFDDIAPSNNIAKSDANIFLIHGIDDATVPIKQADELFEASNHDKVKLWKIEGKGHSDCNHHPDFWLKVLDFYNSTL